MMGDSCVTDLMEGRRRMEEEKGGRRGVLSTEGSLGRMKEWY